MIKYVNNHGLKDSFFRAVVNDKYTRGESDFSATSLASTPRATVLIETQEVEVDISKRVAIIIGKGTHSILEGAGREGIDIVEKRFFMPIEVDGMTYVVSAQVDLFETDTGELQDWKTAKSFAFHKKAGPKAEWESQLNVGAMIMGYNKEEVKSLWICGLLKDWDKRKADTEPGYPPTEFMSVEIKRWTVAQTMAYIEERIRKIVSARESLPTCSSKETWGGNRCGQWCDAASVCSQYQESKKTGLIAPKGEL